jgi:hypothetical protein
MMILNKIFDKNEKKSIYKINFSQILHLKLLKLLNEQNKKIKYFRKVKIIEKFILKKIQDDDQKKVLFKKNLLTKFVLYEFLKYNKYHNNQNNNNNKNKKDFNIIENSIVIHFIESDPNNLINIIFDVIKNNDNFNKIYNNDFKYIDIEIEFKSYEYFVVLYFFN